MATSQTEAESQAREPNNTCLETLIELSKNSFDTFCEDISGMFGVDIECKQHEVAAETVKGLKNRFKKLAVVNSVKAEGSLEGTFQLVFDQDGLFTLAGVIVMHPEEIIFENRKLGSAQKANELREVLVELGDTLVGSWDRTFRKGLDGHGRLVQTNTFVGNPWDNSEKKIGLAGDEELVFVPYEMTIAPYPAFKCGVILPQTIFAGTFVPASKEASHGEEKTQDQKAAVEKAGTEEADVAQKSDGEKSKPQEPIAEKAAAEKTPAKEDTEQTTVAEKEAAARKAKPASKKAGDASKDATEKEPEAAAKEKYDDVNTDTSNNVVEERPTTTAEAHGGEDQPISETIREMARSPAVLPGEPSTSAPAESSALSGTGAAIPAKDIMQKGLLWGSPDDSIQQALTEMQQHNTDCMMIGHDGALEGIVLKSDLTGAISPYLRPAFAKWRRPLDDATLQIKIKWIMTTPVHTIGLETPLTSIMENMFQSGRHVLPVTDRQNNVQGLITVFDVFKALLKREPNISTEAKTTQPPTSA